MKIKAFILLILFCFTTKLKAQVEFVSTGTGAAYVLNVPAVFPLRSGIQITFKANVVCAASPTINVNSTGAISIRKEGGTTSLSSGDIKAGQVVTIVYDGVNWQMLSNLGNPPPLGISGSGTQNQVSKWSDPSGTILGNSSIFDDGNRIGIFNNTPAGDLHIFRNNGPRLILDADGGNVNGTSMLDFTTGGNNSSTSSVGTVSGWQFRSFSSAYNNNIARQNDLQLRFFAGATFSDIMYFDNTGNIGINYLNPTSRLYIVGSGNTSATSSLRITNSSNSDMFYVDDNGQIGIRTALPTANLHVVGTARISSLVGPGNVIADVNGNLSVAPAGTSLSGSGTLNYLARWTPSGTQLGIGATYDNGTNVGIGTINPGLIGGSARYLTISSGNGLPSNFDASSLELHGGSSDPSGVQNKIDFIARSTDGSNYNTGRIEMKNTSSSTLQGQMHFYTKSGSLQDRMMIDENGNVGIGLLAPAARLHSSGQIRTGIPSSGLGGAGATTGSVLFYNSSTNSTLTLQPPVVTTSYTLTLPPNGGSSGYVLTTDGTGVTSWQSASSMANAWTLGGNSVASLQTFGTNTAFDLPFVTNGIERMRLNATGTQLYPSNDNSLNLGSFSNSWRDAHLDGFLYINGAKWTNLSVNNTLVATSADESFTTGIYNTGVGTWAGNNITTGMRNTLLGLRAGESITTSSDNTLIGALSGGLASSLGSNNTFLGAYSGFGAANSGSSNTYIGTGSGSNNSTGHHNAFLGSNAGGNNTTGYFNTFVGDGAGQGNTTGNLNTFTGYLAGNANSADNNTFNGYAAGRFTTSGAYNVFSGTAAGHNNSTGFGNSYYGGTAGYNNNGSFNTFMGYATGYSSTSGDYNTLIGTNAGGSVANVGTYNTYLGYNASGTSGITNSAAIGKNATVTASNAIVLGGTSGDAVRVGIGVTAPTQTLHVVGGARITNLVGPGTVIADASGNLSIATGGTITGSGTTNYVARWTPSGTILGTGLIYDNNSVVGIGTGSTPSSARLNVHSISGGGNLRLTSATTGQTDSDGFAISNDGGAGVTMAQHENSNWIFATNSLPAMTIIPNANVGVGTLSPGNKLVVEDDVDDVMKITRDNTGTFAHIAKLAFSNRYAGGENVLARIGIVDGGSNSGALIFETKSNTTFPDATTTEKMRIIANGNVGIGTQAPGAKLEVADANFFKVKLNRTAGAGFKSELAFSKSGTDRFSIGVDMSDVSTQEFYIYDNIALQNRVHINSAGNVGIGTTNALVKLQVSGQIRMGSETGTSQPPNYPVAGGNNGLTIRRLYSSANAAGQIVAVTDEINLERDGTNGGWRINRFGGTTNQVCNCTGTNSAGGTVGKSLNNLNVGITQLYTNAENIVFIHCIFGNPFGGAHTTEVTLTRNATDYFWMGTTISTFNQ